VALDLPTPREAQARVEKLAGAVRFYKVARALLDRGYFRVIRWLARAGATRLLRPQRFDIPETVRRATANLSRSGASS